MICLIEANRVCIPDVTHEEQKTRHFFVLFLPAGDWSQCFVSTTVIKVLTLTTPTPPGNYYHIHTVCTLRAVPTPRYWSGRLHGAKTAYAEVLGQPPPPTPLNVALVSTMQRPEVLQLEREGVGEPETTNCQVKEDRTFAQQKTGRVVSR